MALLVDKYRPKDLSSLTYHVDQAKDLMNIVKAGDFPHLLIYGPSGAGKSTRIMCLLKAMYGSGVEKLRLEEKSFQAPSGRKLEIHTVSSNYHMQLSPGEVGIYDRVVVQEVIKRMAQMQQIDSGTQRLFKVIVMMEADQLTREAQDALRRTMEKYSETCRIILCCESISRITGPLRSRCMAVRVPAPSDEDIELVLRNICMKEHIKAPDSIYSSIVAKANGNLRRAILLFEAAKAQNYPFKENQTIPDPDWETYLCETAKLILKQQNSETLLKVRNRLYECISRCIPPSLIFVKLLCDLLRGCDEVIKPEIVSVAAEYEHRLCCGSKVIFHLEAFVAAFMDIYYRHANESILMS